MAKFELTSLSDWADKGAESQAKVRQSFIDKVSTLIEFTKKMVSEEVASTNATESEEYKQELLLKIKQYLAENSDLAVFANALFDYESNISADVSGIETQLEEIFKKYNIANFTTGEGISAKISLEPPNLYNLLYEIDAFKSMIASSVKPDPEEVIDRLDGEDVVPHIVVSSATVDKSKQPPTSSPATFSLPDVLTVQLEPKKIPAVLHQMKMIPAVPLEMKMIPAVPLVEMKKIRLTELAEFLAIANKHNLILPNHVRRDDAIEAFFNDPGITDETKDIVRNKFLELKDATKENIQKTKEFLEFLLNFPSYGLAEDTRDKHVNGIVEKMVQAAQNCGSSATVAQEKAALLELDKEIERINKECEESKLKTGVAILKDKFIENYKNELRDKYNARMKGEEYKPKAYYPPFNLDGPPGTGKTSVVSELATIFKFGYFCLDMQTMSEQDVKAIAGLGTHYTGGGEAGLVAQAKKINSSNSVLFMLDEAEKADPKVMNAFAGLLATGSSTGEKYRDNYFGTDIPAIGINFVLSTNKRSKLESHIQSRVPKVDFPGYPSIEAKLEIIKTWLAKQDDRVKAVFTEDMQRYLIKYYSYQPGVRELGLAFTALTTKIGNNMMGKTAKEFADQFLSGEANEHKYVDDCMQEAKITRLTEEQQSISTLSKEFEKLKQALEDQIKTDPTQKDSIEQARAQLVLCGSKLTASIEDVLDLHYLAKHNLQDDLEYINYANKLLNYALYEVYFNKNQQIKSSLAEKEYLADPSNRLIKLQVKQEILKEELRALTDVELKKLDKTIRSDKHSEIDGELVRSSNLIKQQKILDVRIKFIETKIKVVDALSRGQKVDDSLIQDLRAYHATYTKHLSMELAAQSRTSPSEEQPKKIQKLEKRIGNIQKLIDAALTNNLTATSSATLDNQHSSSMLGRSVDGSLPKGIATEGGHNDTITAYGTTGAPALSADGSTFTVNGSQAALTPQAVSAIPSLLSGLASTFTPIGIQGPAQLPIMPGTLPLPQPYTVPAGLGMSGGAATYAPSMQPPTGTAGYYPPVGTAQPIPMVFSSGGYSGASYVAAPPLQPGAATLSRGKNWYPVQTTQMRDDVITYGRFHTEGITAKEPDVVGNPPHVELRSFSIQRLPQTSGLMMYSKVNMVDQDMVDQMISQQMQSGNRYIHINGLCKAGQTPEQQRDGAQAYQMFLHACGLRGLTVKFDEVTESIVKHMQPASTPGSSRR